MKHNWKTLLIPAILFSWLLLPAVAKAQPNPPPRPDNNKEKSDGEAKGDLAEIKKGIDQLFTELQKVGESFKKVGEDMQHLQKELTDLKDEKMDMQLKLSAAQAEIKDLKQKLGEVQKDIKNLRKSVPDVRLYPPIAKDSYDQLQQKVANMEQALAQMQAGQTQTSKSSPISTARVVLVNATSEEIMFLINGRSFRVAPYSSRTLLDQSIGAFTYEVFSETFGLLRRNTTTLNPNETFTITVG